LGIYIHLLLDPTRRRRASAILSIICARTATVTVACFQRARVLQQWYANDNHDLLKIWGSYSWRSLPVDRGQDCAARTQAAAAIEAGAIGRESIMAWITILGAFTEHAHPHLLGGWHGTV
jgi:hypothetical protein